MRKDFSWFKVSILAAALVSASFLGGLLFPVVDVAKADDLQNQIDSDNQQIAALNEKIAQYEAQLQQIGADKKTLQAAISALDLQRSKVQAQVTATQRQINVTQLQIQQLDGQIGDTQASITANKETLGRYLQIIQESDDVSLVSQLLNSGNLSDFWSGVQETLQLQDSIRQKIDGLKGQKVQLAGAQASEQTKQSELTSQKQDLASQQQSLTTTVKSKSQLLAQTKAQESTYQKLLAEAEAQLESFSAFSQNAGGAGLVGQQTVCDAWGCYYNQRDAAWGSLHLNNTKYTLASDGCLVTSMAMVMTHYGYKGITPISINSNPANFAAYYPAFLLNTVTARGVTASRVTAAIDATLAAGDPVIVGVKAYGGTHFVVIVSGRGGNYVMRDPYIDNGKDISFSANYKVKSIFSVAKVVIGG